jgi:hypothetical protein
MLANRLAVYKKRNKKRKGIPEDTAGLYIRIQRTPGQTLGGERKKTDEAIGPTSYFDMESPVTDWLLRSAERMHLETNLCCSPQYHYNADELVLTVGILPDLL